MRQSGADFRYFCQKGPRRKNMDSSILRWCYKRIIQKSEPDYVVKRSWTYFQECSLFFQNFFDDSLQFFFKIIQSFRTIFINSFKNCLKNFTKFPEKCFFFRSLCEMFPIFFLRFLLSIFAVSLKLFQKKFLKFLHDINGINFKFL